MKKTFLPMLLLLLVLYAGASAANETAYPVEFGEMAFDFTATLLDGSQFTLSDCRGKVVFVNIWASWCGTCVEEIPDLQQLADTYPDTLVVLGVNFGENEQTVRDFIAVNTITYPQAADEGFALINAVFPTRGIPYTVVIDPAGAVAGTEVGPRSYDRLNAMYDAAMLNAPVVETAPAPADAL